MDLHPPSHPWQWRFIGVCLNFSCKGQYYRVIQRSAFSDMIGMKAWRVPTILPRLLAANVPPAACHKVGSNVQGHVSGTSITFHRSIFLFMRLTLLFICVHSVFVCNKFFFYHFCVLTWGRERSCHLSLAFCPLTWNRMYVYVPWRYLNCSWCKLSVWFFFRQGFDHSSDLPSLLSECGCNLGAFGKFLEMLHCDIAHIWE